MGTGAPVPTYVSPAAGALPDIVRKELDPSAIDVELVRFKYTNREQVDLDLNPVRLRFKSLL
jgi:hypothetical protein